MATVGTRYTSIRKVVTQAQFTCSACSHSAPVEVTGVGDGSSDASYLLGNDQSAKAKAAAKAQVDAVRAVPRMLGLAPCPKCGQRDPVWVRRYWLGHLARLLGWMALLGVGTGLCFLLSRLPPSWTLRALIVVEVCVLLIYPIAAAPFFDLKMAQLCVKFKPAGAPDPES